MDTTEWISYLEQFNLSAESFQNIPKNTDKYCVIIEPRCHELLIPVIKNFMYLLQNKGWGLIIFHGTENEIFLHNELKNWKNVNYFRMQVSNLSSNEYSNLLCSLNFWDILLKIGCKHSLIFQVDTVLLKDNIDDFLEYHYIGAPWCVKWLGILEIGNGGLSLRNVCKMYDIVKNCPRNAITNLGERYLNNEDIYFSFYLKIIEGSNIPSIDIAKKFAVETIYHDDTCGLHQPHINKFPDRDAFVKLLSKRYL
uniref:DUF5672 domain-containing protein n=1 Tax=viral metagenome TaxID=1070528 RepID=A0A6C0I020_9ZZZZ